MGFASSPSPTTHAFISSPWFPQRLKLTHTYLSSPRRVSPLRRPRSVARAVLNEPAQSHPQNELGDMSPDYVVHDWTFKSFRVQYATSGVGDSDTHTLPAVVLVHGFGANCQHWRHNIAPLAQRGFRVYAMDLLGFGMGDKPSPGTVDSDGDEVEYTFDYWTSQLGQFLQDVVFRTDFDQRVFLVANSIGCMVTMQYAIENPDHISALTFISPSLRQLNVRKRSWVQDITAPLLMKILAYRPIGAFFLESLSKPNALRRVLNNAYSVSSAVDDDLIRILREPAKTEGALDVFLSFITYDTGPIPEDFLPDLTQPALVLWGEDDQFEPFELGQKLKHYSIVEKFVALPRTGHCAHDERPEKCNELMGDFLEKHRQRKSVQPQ